MHAQPATPAPAVQRALAEIAVIEDGRGKHGTPAAALHAYLRHSSADVRQASVRALGRLQQPSELPAIYTRLADQPAVRAEALNAIAQSLRGAPQPSRDVVAAAIDTITAVAQRSSGSHLVAGVAARSIGRLPHRDSAQARVAEQAILALRSSRTTATDRVEGILHGLYALARARRTLGSLTPEALTFAQQALADRRPGTVEARGRVRRLAMLVRSSAGAVDAQVIDLARTDTDEQVRRLAAVAAATLSDRALSRTTITSLLDDRSPIVRHEAVRGWRSLIATEGCAPLLRAIGDGVPHVALAAIDGLVPTCRDRQAVADTLLALIDRNRSDSPVRARGRGGWHVHAHALVALARVDSARAILVIRREARETEFWALRAWIARAAAAVRDTATLRVLALAPAGQARPVRGSGNGNVRELALGALATTAGHAADDVYLAALDAPEYHVVAEAAQALRGSPDRARVSEALVRTLQRVTSERLENTRDPRVALLERLEELGAPANATALEPFVTDFDTAVAIRAAAILSRWTGRAVTAMPRPQAPPREEIAPLMRASWRARFTMSPNTGGGSFEVILHARETPFTVARFVRLARAGWYDGLTFHRVEPGFVIQGGSPAANEYVGDGPFMRDELGLRSHTRGTFGISTRGRDTGDAQLFVNLTDNFRLDHDYTVFGEIVRGREVAEAILEADVIAKVEIVAPLR